MAAIKSVVTVLADYDSDQQFPAFGFGAKVPEFGGMSHCFPLNFNTDQPEVKGLKVKIQYSVYRLVELAFLYGLL